ncbi:MAG: hypothetical protein K6F69_09785 [Treponema sp.]|nr:hypothetical protein [Treponema sp.]
MEPFSVKDVEQVLASAGIHLRQEELADYLNSCPSVFALENNRYLTYAAAFDGFLFSIKPTKQEVDKGVFIVGHRCIPFVDSDMLPHQLKFIHNGRKLRTTEETFDSDFVIEHYSLFGEEYAVQYIAEDPANRELDLMERDFLLPQKVKLTCVSLKPFIKENAFKYGDRLLCRIVNWDEGKIGLIALPDRRKSLFEAEPKRERWYRSLENALLRSFKRFGPCTSINEQLSKVFYEYKTDLCDLDCGSIEEFLQRNDKVAFESFGVETRLWKKGEEIPAVGAWNYDAATFENGTGVDANLIVIPDFVLDNFIVDSFVNNVCSLEDLPKYIIPGCINLGEEENKELQEQIKNRSVMLKKSYNRFADFNIAPVRHRALCLYKKIWALMCEIDSLKKDLRVLPQAELVLLSQLFSHSMRMLQSLLPMSDISEEIESIDMSLEGMEFNFEDVSVLLEAELAKQQRSDYIVI